MKMMEKFQFSNSNLEAAMDTYPGNAEETTIEANKDDGNISNSNSEAVVNTYSGNNINQKTFEILM